MKYTKIILIVLVTMLTLPVSGYGNQEVGTAKQAARQAEKAAAKKAKVNAKLTKRVAKKEAEIARRRALLEVKKKEAELKADEKAFKRNAKKAKKATEAAAQQERLKNRLNLNCPDGGWENVVITGDLVGNAFRVSGNRAARFLLARYMGLVETINPYDEVVHISEGGRPVVYNMCPHGNITLPAVLSSHAGVIDIWGRSHSSEEFVWTARRFVNGHLYYGVSRKMSLYVYQWRKEKKAQWVMKVEDIDRSLPGHPLPKQSRRR